MLHIIILCDLDDVLAEATDPAIQRYNEEYGASLSRDDIKDFGMLECVPAGTSIVKYYDEPGFYASFKAVTGAREFIEKIQQLGHDVIVVTSSPEHAIKEKYNWLRQNIPTLPFENIFPITRKELIYGDLMIDDKIENLETTRCSAKLLMDKPWNRHCTSKEIIRVNSLEEAFAIINPEPFQDTNPKYYHNGVIRKHKGE